jgi:hypothetical protein
MNRVLNKDFGAKSSNNATLIAFSDVFHPACSMQKYPVIIMERPANRTLRSFDNAGVYPVYPAKENLMRSGNAC